MSLESFYHEIALRQSSADRDNLKFTPPWWKRRLAALPASVRRLLALTFVASLAAAGWLSLPLLNQYVFRTSPHPPGAADVLATVTHRVSPAERAHRLVLACARENNPHACQEALRHALTVAQPREVVSWLKAGEIHALRVNAYFDQFVSRLEAHPDQLDQLPTTPARPALYTPPARSSGVRASQLPSPARERPASPVPAFQSLKPLPDAPNHGGTDALDSVLSTSMPRPPSPAASVNISNARSINPTDDANQPPIKTNPDGIPAR